MGNHPLNFLGKRVILTGKAVPGVMRTVDWIDGKVKMIDQTKLPLEEVLLEYSDYKEVARAIKLMKVRGAPAIGVTAAFGIALGAREADVKSTSDLLKRLDEICDVFSKTRPTAVNLFWAIRQMRKKAYANRNLNYQQVRALLLDEAKKIAKEDEEACRKIGGFGATLIDEGDNILTHCNAGGLATVSYGTALGVIRCSHEQKKKIHVWVDETRPRLQGTRLTAWELKKARIPMTLITDNMAGLLMSKKKIDKVVVGADRIAKNGDIANKVGTYSLAVLADAHNIPFYVAAPMSTIDFSCASGDEIAVEERSQEEVTTIEGRQIAPAEVDVYNPAFDVTPGKYIKAIVTEKGIAHPPYKRSLKVWQ